MSEMDLSGRIAQRQKSLKGKPIRDHREKHLMVLPERVMKTTAIVLSPKDYARMAVDERYQRSEMRGWVGDLRDALARGTVTPPIHLVRRHFEESGEISKRLWIVDGQQRMWAHVDMGRDVHGLVHEVDSLEEEIHLFTLLNSGKPIGALIYVRDWTGPSVKLLKAVNQNEAHPMFGRISWDRGRNEGGKFNPVSLVDTVTALLGQSNGVRNSLPAIDGWIAKNGSQHISLLLSMIALVFPAGSFYDTWVLRAFAKVFKELKRGLTKAEIARLRRVRLKNVLASTNGERALLMQRRMEKALRMNGYAEEAAE